MRAQLLRPGVVRRSDGKARRSRAVDPLVEELIQVRAGGLLERLHQIFGDHVSEPILFQVVFQAAEKRFVAQLLSQHLQDQAGLVVDIARVLAANR